MMDSRKNLITIIVIAIIWFGSSITSKFLISEKNPPIRYSGIILGNDADKVLRRDCFNCHSNETKWPWYSFLPIASILIPGDVVDARKHLNFSTWKSMHRDQQVLNLKKIINEIEHDKMPPLRYRLAHPESEITGSELVMLKKSENSMDDNLNSVE